MFEGRNKQRKVRHGHGKKNGNGSGRGRGKGGRRYGFFEEAKRGHDFVQVDNLTGDRKVDLVENTGVNTTEQVVTHSYLSEQPGMVPTVCPLCKNHCPLNEPSCKKGEAFAASLQYNELYGES